jgi:excisionase family DNA binding protein
MHGPAYAEPEPLAYDIATASRVSTIGKTRLYELIAAGRLATTKIGKRRLIHADSLRRLIQEGL